MADTLILNSDGMPLSMIPLSVIPWQVAVRQIFTGKVQVLKEYSDWEVHSQHLTIKVPSVVIMVKQKKWAKTLKYSKQNIFVRDDFTCQLQITNSCKSRHGKSDTADLTLDHVVPRSHGGITSWTNVTTSCKACNSEKGNDKNIVPKKMPKQPSYYEILAKKKTMPINIKDEEWKFYIQWPEHLVNVIPHNKTSSESEFILED